MDKRRRRYVVHVGWVVLCIGLFAGCEAATFTISGDAAEPIFPGVAVPLDLEFTNPNSISLLVTDLQVTVQDVSAPNANGHRACTVADFEVEQVSDTLEISVPANETLTLSSLGLEPAGWPRVGMLIRPGQRAGCDGATLELHYEASGQLVKP